MHPVEKPRIGLVLGAGGVVGQAYHSGVLAALEHDYGWDPRTAEVIVGTSAGSITGMLLRGGVPASELAAWTVRAPLASEGRLLSQLFGEEIPKFDPFFVRDVLRRPPSLPGRHMLSRAVLRPWQFRPLAASLALLAPGPRDITEQLDALSAIEDRPWPDQDLWLCAVRRHDGRRVVFGRDGAPEAPLNLAVAASCAVPGYFRPVRIGERTYVDGGAHSPTNAAVLRGRPLDLVIVVSPMSGPPGKLTDLYAGSRWHSARIAAREVEALRRNGTPVVVFRPGQAEQEAMGNDFMARDRLHEIVQQSFFGAGRHASRPETRTTLATLLGSARVRRPTV
ncbi:MAG: patatin-like phospholipase family protein [Nocardioides sp.]